MILGFHASTKNAKSVVVKNTGMISREETPINSIEMELIV